MPPYQTVFYDSDTFKILKVEKNLYIRSRSQLKSILAHSDASKISFLYFKAALPVDPAFHTLKYMGPNVSPYIAQPDGMPLVYLTIREPFVDAMKCYKTIIVDLEDSMGDNLYRANAVLEAMKKHQDINFLCKVDPQYLPVISLIPGLNIFTSYKALGLEPSKCAIIKMSAGMLADPMGDYYSAPSRYALFLGLNKVEYSVKIDRAKLLKSNFAAFSAAAELREDGHNIAFQLITSTDASRSWKKEYILELARLIKAEYDCNIYSIGQNSDLVDAGTDIINLTGKTSWTETLYLLTQCSHVFCCDSSVLHLCHALDIKPYALYGHTQPRGVTGEPATEYDIGVQTSNFKNVAEAVTPADVFRAAFKKIEDNPIIYKTKAADTSEHGEQKFIEKFFEDHPPKYNFVVDVGAYGKELSNSFALLAAGWKGLLIEADPQRCKRIKKEFAGLSYVLINAGVSDIVSRLPFHIHSCPGHSSFKEDWYKNTLTNKKIMVDVFPLADHLERAKVPYDFDFLTIDTEGLDFIVMRNFFEFSKYRPGLIITESTSYPSGQEFFKNYGYELINFFGAPGWGNYVFARESLL